MTSFFTAFAVAAAVGISSLIWAIKRRQGSEIPWIFLYLSFILPFAAGGFHTYLAVPTTVLLLGNLILVVRRKKTLRIFCNVNSTAVLLVVLGYCVTPLWAADKGMAIFGIIRYLPLLLYAVTLMQYPAAQRKQALAFVPLCGAVMTGASILLLLIPDISGELMVNGRLSGFFQYPNTFAVFLLAGLVLQNTKETRGKTDILIDTLLIFGVILSGSRTAFILLGAALIGIALLRRKLRIVIPLAASFVCGLILATAAANLELLNNADRFTTISATSGTFLVRLLYFKDALSVILKNPFGLGYYGYRTLEGTFQTGRYAVSYVHNGLLQLFLDVGWIPAVTLAVAFLRGLFSRKTPSGSKLLLFIVLAHCMLDFDLQFFAVWVILLSQLEFTEGKEVVLRQGKVPGLALGAVLVSVSLWLGIGDLCYNLGAVDACLAVTPFHTDALTAALVDSEDSGEADAIADRILALNESSSIAYSAKANYAFSSGKILAMIEYKENAIRCAKYTTEEYCDYFDKLYLAIQLYTQAGDTSSASYCLEKLMTIPDLMEAVSRKTDPLANMTGDDSTLQLPEEYQTRLDSLK